MVSELAAFSLFTRVAKFAKPPTSLVSLIQVSIWGKRWECKSLVWRIVNSFISACNKKDKNIQGFSLIEILVVLLIIGLLTTLVVVNVLPSQDKARVEKAKADIAIIENALEMYRLDNYNYPTTDQGLNVLVKPLDSNNTFSNVYIKRLPKDPWGNDYQYLSPGDNGVYDVFSFGADGEEGGENLNSDIGNWDEN